MPKNTPEQQAQAVRPETTRDPVLEPTPDGYMPDSFAKEVTVNPEHGEIKRIADPEERNGGAFRPVLQRDGKPDLEVRLENIIDEHATQFSGDGMLISRPEWELPKSKPISALYVTTENKL